MRQFIVLLSLEDKENVQRENKSSRTARLEERKPLQSIKPLSVLREREQPDPQSSPDDELELLCAEEDLLPGTGERGVVDENCSEDDLESEFERQMEELMIDADKAPPSNPAPAVAWTRDHLQPTVEEMSVVHKDNLSYLSNQENQPRDEVKASAFDFTPRTVEGDTLWPVFGQK